VLFPITLGVGRKSDAERSISSSQRLDKKRAEQIFHRDDFTCRFCEFRSASYQRIVPWKDAGNPPYATACSFCEQALMLDRTGLSGGGILIWLPEISQIKLNHVMRAIYVARAVKSEFSAAASRAADALMARRADTKKRLGGDDPLLLATVMHEQLTDEEYKNAADKLEGIRLFPLDKHLVRTARGDINQFPQMVKFWCSSSGPFARLPVEEWTSLFKSATVAAGGNA